MSLTQHERDHTGTKKAEDWDGLDAFCKLEPVGTPKVHGLKFGQEAGSMHGKVTLVPHEPYGRSLGAHVVDCSSQS